MNVPDLVRTVDEFVFALRSAGVVCSVDQVIVAVRGLSLMGLSDRARVRATLLACLASSGTERAIASRIFDDFFLAHQRARSLEQALQFADLSDAIPIVHAWLESERVTDHETDLAHLMNLAASRKATLGEAKLAYDVTNDARLGHAKHQMGTLRLALRGALGADVADRAFDVASTFLEHAMRRTRDLARGRVESPPVDNEVDRVRLSDREIDRLLRQSARQLNCRLRLLRRGTLRRPIDPRRLFREQARTHGVPVCVPRLRNRRQPPAFFFLCDVSDSTRPIADLLLAFIARASYFFKCSRAYVFASTTVEITGALIGHDASHMTVHQAGVGQVSNYGAAIREFVKLARRQLDRRSIVVVLGDGRANYRDPGLVELGALRVRVRELIWLCSEESHRWSADSLMPRYRLVASRNGQLASPHDVAASARLLGSLR